MKLASCLSLDIILMHDDDVDDDDDDDDDNDEYTLSTCYEK
jgi:hypothetical protein